MPDQGQRAGGRARGRLDEAAAHRGRQALGQAPADAAAHGQRQTAVRIQRERGGIERADGAADQVGGGGIGNVIRVELSRFNYGRLSALIIALFVVVFALDALSRALRRRLV